MGCTSSKGKKHEIRKIDYDLSATYTLQMDQFFDDVKDCLKSIEQLRSGIEDNHDNLLKDTYSIYLKSPTLKDALMIMFWCISANHQGDIQKCKPVLQDSPPNLSMELNDNIREEVKNLWKYFTKYMDTVREGPLLISMELLKYENYLEETEGFVERGVDDALSVHDTQLKKTQAALNISRNITKIQDQARAIRRVKEVIEDARKEAEKLTDVVEELIKTADEVGVKAFEEGLFTPEEICLHFHPQLNKDNWETEASKFKTEKPKTLKGSKKAKKA